MSTLSAEPLVLMPTLAEKSKTIRKRVKPIIGTVAQLRVLSWGVGVQSSTLAFMSAFGDLPKLDLIIHADTTWEREETYKFFDRWVPWFEERGIPVISASSLSARNPMREGNRTHIPAYVRNNRGIVTQINRQCTSRWKIDVVRRIIRHQMLFKKLQPRPGIVEQWLGISWDEAHRMTSVNDVSYINLRYPLIFDQRMTRNDCVNYLQQHDIEVPVKSACTHCPYHSQENWEAMKRANGPDWKQAVEFDLAIRGKSTKYDGMFIHRSAKPLTRAVLLPEDEGYVQPDLMPGPGCDTAGYCWD